MWSTVGCRAERTLHKAGQINPGALHYEKARVRAPIYAVPGPEEVLNLHPKC